MQREEGRAGRRALVVCLAAGGTTLVDQSVLNIALPSLRDALTAGPSSIQWIVSGYSLAFGLAWYPAAASATYADARACSCWDSPPSWPPHWWRPPRLPRAP
ncbi:hypothetical protein AB0J21_00075 [Streptomyces sp. NPDC049954]|uniref:hypothetical protein n=1 Tax=Streptomyces sp. NPDC049954 TaxID=3155779 RepID=UPI00341B344F